MSTKALMRLVEAADDKADGYPPKLVREARKELVQVETMKALLREMFTDEALDPYPTSDGSPEYRLRKWCGWTRP